MGASCRGADPQSLSMSMSAPTAPTAPLSGCAAFITGAGQGLGAALAEGLAAAGARVALADIDGDASAAWT